MAIRNEFCADCGAFIKGGESTCPKCGTAVAEPVLPQFNWEPSDPSLARTRSVLTAQKGVTNRHSTTSAPALTAAGVIILATISAFSFWFGVSIGVVGVFNEPDGTFREGVTTEDYFTRSRMILSMLLAAVLTAITWAVALSIAEQ